MKAVIHTKFGPPEELKLTEVNKPVPKNNEVLIRVYTSTVTSSDCNMRNMTFAPKWAMIPFRLFLLGLFRPRIHRLGIDLAGEIEAAGKNVKRFRKGDKIFGTSLPALGTHAEYICIPEKGVLTQKPARINWSEAAAIPLAGNTALYFIRDLGNVRPGQTILINGASGGIGTFAVQLAKYYGARVTAVCSTANIRMVKDLGADKVIDYTKEDFTRSNETYDIIFDTVGKTSYSPCRNSLKEKGVYLTTLPTLAVMFQALWTSITGSRKVKFGDAVPNVDNLIFLKKLIVEGRLKLIIDRNYSLEQAAAAYRYVEQGHKKGSVVITVHRNKK